MGAKMLVKVQISPRPDYLQPKNVSCSGVFSI
jgi:hypothetical protein